MPIDPCAEGCLNHNIGATEGPSAGDDPCNSAGNGYFCAGSIWTFDPTAGGADTATWGDCDRAWMRTGGDCNVDQWLEISVANIITDTVPPVDGVDCCPPGTMWCVPASPPVAINQIWIQTGCTGDNCRWCKICGFGQSEMNVTGTPIVAAPEGISTQIPFATNVQDELGVVTLPSFTIRYTGCYLVEAWALLQYYGGNYESSITRLVLRNNGIAQFNLGDMSMATLNRPPGNVITHPVQGSGHLCATAGDVLTVDFLFTTSLGGQVIDLESSWFKIRELKW